MHIGTLLLVPVSNSVTKEVFTPWFPRGGDGAVFTYQQIYKIGSPATATVEVWHKNREDAGDSPGSALATLNTEIYSNKGFYTPSAIAVTGIKELVRFKVKVTSSGTPTFPEGMLYRILAPTWFPLARS